MGASIPPDPALVGQLAQAQAQGYALWQEAKQADAFERFAPALKTLIELRLEQARQLAPVEQDPSGQKRSPWEILAQPFEPDISKAQLSGWLLPLRQELPPLLEQARSIPQGSQEVWDLTELSQETLCGQLLQEWGYNAERCHRARSPHPFSSTLGPDDFRITTRVVPLNFSAFLATAHEWGHSLYEQGCRTRPLFPWPLGSHLNGRHESHEPSRKPFSPQLALAQRWHPAHRSPWQRHLGKPEGLLAGPQSDRPWPDPRRSR